MKLLLEILSLDHFLSVDFMIIFQLVMDRGIKTVRVRIQGIGPGRMVIRIKYFNLKNSNPIYP